MFLDESALAVEYTNHGRVYPKRLERMKCKGGMGMNVKKMIARDGLIILGVVVLGGIVASQFFDGRFMLLKKYFYFVYKIVHANAYLPGMGPLKVGAVMGMLPPVIFIIWAIKTLKTK